MGPTSDDGFPRLKLLLIGSANVGKSALMRRYCFDTFENDGAATIGVDYAKKRLHSRGHGYVVNIFDTAGQERFRTMSTSFYRGAQGVILVYDISNRASFEAMDKWFEEALDNTQEKTILYLVGAKLDKADRKRAVSTAEGEELARMFGVGFCEVSAKTRDNVRVPFVEVVDRITRDRQQLMAKAETNAVQVSPFYEMMPRCAC